MMKIGTINSKIGKEKIRSIRSNPALKKIKSHKRTI
jgi:hypothetical protein